MMSNDPQNAYNEAYGTGAQLPGPNDPTYNTNTKTESERQLEDYTAQAPRPAFAQPFSDGTSQTAADTAAYAPPAGDPYQGAQAYAASASAPAPQNKSHGWVVAIIIVVCIALVCIAGIASCSSLTSSLVSPVNLFSDNASSAPVSGPHVAVIEIDGTIQHDGTSSSPEGLHDLLDEAAEDPDVAAVVLRVNSGGGVSTAGEEMAEYIRDFEKPIVVSSAAANESAAYELSSQADYIFVDKTTLIGAIGVFMQITNLSGLYEKLGIDFETIASDDSKIAGQGTRPLTDEEKAWFQEMVDQINTTFIETVARGRGMTYDEVSALANGLPYTGLNAVENGLADEVGLIDDAVMKASELAGYDYELPQTSLTYSPTDIWDILNILGTSESESADVSALSDALNKIGARNAVE